MDLLPGDPPQAVVGGSVLNTAVALGRLGVPVGMLTGISSDQYGGQIDSHLTDAGVDTSLCVRSDRPTTLAIVTLTDGQATYRFEDEGSALRMIGRDDLPALPGSVQAMVFGGISLIQPPVADTLADLCVNRPTGTLGFLDANVRPDFVTDPEAYRLRLNRMLVACDVLKVSDEDLDWLGTDAGDPVADLLSRGPACVLLTKGGDGAEAHLADGRCISVAAQKVDVIDTVGAGDTFNAGFLASLLSQDLLSRTRLETASDAALTDALTLGAKAAAITVSRAGANPPWAHEIG